jgi:hypothetical protein
MGLVIWKIFLKAPSYLVLYDHFFDFGRTFFFDFSEYLVGCVVKESWAFKL